MILQKKSYNWLRREAKKAQQRYAAHCALRSEIEEFILWLTPCGEVEPGPTLKTIGHWARKLNRKIQLQNPGGSTRVTGGAR